MKDIIFNILKYKNKINKDEEKFNLYYDALVDRCLEKTINP